MFQMTGCGGAVLLVLSSPGISVEASIGTYLPSTIPMYLPTYGKYRRYLLRILEGFTEGF